MFVCKYDITIPTATVIPTVTAVSVRKNSLYMLQMV